jgi:hypothetical protein
MGLLVDGAWRDQNSDTAVSGGRLVRKDGAFRNWVTATTTCLPGRRSTPPRRMGGSGSGAGEPARHGSRGAAAAKRRHLRSISAATAASPQASPIQMPLTPRPNGKPSRSPTGKPIAQ